MASPQQSKPGDHTQTQGLYIHVPFCASRCIYCAFPSSTLLSLLEEYVSSVLREFSLRRAEWCDSTFGTLYLGGGTPSQLGTLLCQSLLSGLYSTAGALMRPCEVTIECNPDDVDDAFSHWLGTSMVTRVSMGAQTFDDNRLRWLHRRHTSRQVGDAVRRLRAAGIGNISLDLIYGYPAQSLDDFKRDLDHLLALSVEHISVYNLTIEPFTPLGRMVEHGEVEELADDQVIAMYEHLVSTLCSAGYEHYEISNFARPGYRSQHNSAYWHDVPYIGLGAGAHSYDLSTRSWNTDNVKAYISAMTKGERLCEQEELSATDRYNDMIVTALRTREGISLKKVLETFGDRFQHYLLLNAQPAMTLGCLEEKEGHLRFTSRGVMVSNRVMTDLVMA